MKKEDRDKLLRTFDALSQRIKTEEEAIEHLKMVGILANNGDLSPNYYPYPKGCLQVWDQKKV